MKSKFSVLVIVLLLLQFCDYFQPVNSQTKARAKCMDYINKRKMLLSRKKRSSLFQLFSKFHQYNSQNPSFNHQSQSFNLQHPGLPKNFVFSQPNPSLDIQNLFFKTPSAIFNSQNSFSKSPYSINTDTNLQNPIYNSQFQNIQNSKFYSGGSDVYESHEDMSETFYSALPIGGTGVKLGDYPHMAALGYRQNKSDPENFTWVCGGSLISERWVLTAAHCTYYGKDSERVTLVQIGTIDLRYRYGPIYHVRQIHLPKDYTRSTFYNDIALVKLHKKADFNFYRYLFPACLTGQFSTVFNITALGWGITETGRPSEILLKVSLEYFPRCSRFYRPQTYLPQGIDEDTQFCFGSRSTNMDTCSGDSGGPLSYLHPSTGMHYVIGVTSFGRGCGVQGYPSVYTNVFYFIKWIEDIVWQN